LALPWGQNLYPKDNEIHNFGRGLPALHHHAFSFSYIHVVSEKKIFFLRIGQFCHILPCPTEYRGARNLKFTIYVPLVPKMHHTKFEKNWRNGYQEGVKNVQMLTRDGYRQKFCIAIYHDIFSQYRDNIMIF
jgi:hypothetical protein